MPPRSPESIPFDYTLDRSEIRKILNYEYAHNLDSLLVYSESKDPSLRYAVMKAFSSFQTPEARVVLEKHLVDSAVEVSEMAAFSLGQIGDSRSIQPLIKAFRSDDKTGIFSKLNSNILEAVGKCGGQEELQLLSNISTYRSSDSILLLGRTRGIYRLMLRNVRSDEGANAMAALLLNQNNPPSVRELAANYFYRDRDADLTNYTYSFRKILEEDSSPYIRMGIATALARSAQSQGVNFLLEYFKREKDERVKVNLLRGFMGNPSIQIESFIRLNYPSFTDQCQEISAAYLLANGTEDGSFKYWDLARLDSLSPRADATLMAAADRHLPFYYTVTKNAISRRLKQKVTSAKTIYERMAYWDAMAENPANISTLISYWNIYTEPLEKSALTQAYSIAWSQLEKSGGTNLTLQKIMANAFQNAVLSGDAGATAIASTTIDANWDSFKTYFTDSEEIRKVQESLNLPAEIETYNEMGKLLARIENTQFQPRRPLTSKTVNWELYDKISDQTRALINTNQGKIELKFHQEDCPMSAINFIQLTQEGFYSNKIFHRVVPNFVIQTGCPRGDGFGSLDFSLRSEFTGLNYDSEGMVGMASAGPHTESTQWFITHSPTPHLDGRYSLFAEVTEGMDAVQKIRTGDQIINIELLNLK